MQMTCNGSEVPAAASGPAPLPLPSPARGLNSRRVATVACTVALAATVVFSGGAWSGAAPTNEAVSSRSRQATAHTPADAIAHDEAIGAGRLTIASRAGAPRDQPAIASRSVQAEGDADDGMTTGEAAEFEKATPDWEPWWLSSGFAESLVAPNSSDSPVGNLPTRVSDGRTRAWRAHASKTSTLCYYLVENFCVERGALVLYKTRDDKADDSTSIASAVQSSGFRLCNELRGKISLKVQTKVLPRHSEHAAPHAQNISSLLPHRLSPRPAHITACWQYYGFHLYQCAVAAWYAEQQLLGRWSAVSSSNLNETSAESKGPNGYFPTSTHTPRRKSTDSYWDMWLYNHAASLPKAVREHYSHQMYMGPSDVWSWSGSNQSSTTSPRDAKTGGAWSKWTPWWGMWAASAASPSAVHELHRHAQAGDGGADSSTNVCYRWGLVGAPSHHAVPAAARRAHARALLRHHDANGTRSTQHAQGRGGAPDAQPVQILILQRGAGAKQGSRKIQNIAAVEAVLRKEASTLEAKLNARAASRRANDDTSDVRPVAISVRTVDLATLPFAEQMRLVSRSQVLVAPHGAANTWMAFLGLASPQAARRPVKEGGARLGRNSNHDTQRSSLSRHNSSVGRVGHNQQRRAAAMVELWQEDTIKRDVYQLLSRQVGVTYAPVFAQMRPLWYGTPDARFSFLHQDVEVPLSALNETFWSAVVPAVFPQL